MRKHGFPRLKVLPALAILVVMCAGLHAQVNYEEGRRTINGVLLLQDANDAKKFYYLPPYPRLSPLPDGGFEFLAVKFVDPEGDAGGGLLHFLVQFDLPQEVVDELQTELRKSVPGAEILGPVPMAAPAGKEKESGSTSFKVVSAVLTDEGDLTRRLISSGHAPLTPGSKAAVAAILNQEGATLLWDTLDGQTSDISISISGNYEAVVEAFNGRIHADISTVYEHFSAVMNRQRGYTKREMRDVVDELLREGTIEVEVFDRGEGLGVDTATMQRVTDLVTDKLVNLIFDTESGLARVPEREKAVEQGQIAGRQEKGWLDKLFTGTGDQEYFTDNQFVMKQREDITQSVFNITLSGKTTIKVPFSTAGNMRGFYTANKDNPEMFRIVNLADPSFQKREVHFTIDRDYVDAFKDTVNFVTVNFRKRHGDQPETTHELQITHQDVAEGRDHKFVTYPRLGEAGAEWLNYEFRLSWSVFGRDTVKVPEAEGQWLTASDSVINLLPPFTKTSLMIEADRSEFDADNVQSGLVEVRYTLLGQDKQERLAVLRAKDTEPMSEFALYHDQDRLPEIRITWYGKSGLGTALEDWRPIDASYLFLTPHEFEKPDEEEPAEEKPAEEPPR